MSMRKHYRTRSKAPASDEPWIYNPSRVNKHKSQHNNYATRTTNHLNTRCYLPILGFPSETTVLKSYAILIIAASAAMLAHFKERVGIGREAANEVVKRVEASAPLVPPSHTR